MRYRIILERKDDGYTAQCLELPQAISQGDTRKEVLENMREAMELIIDCIEEDINSSEIGEVVEMEL